MPLREKVKINLIEEISYFPNKRITYKGIEIEVRSLINIIYELFYKNEGCPVQTVDIVKELFCYSNAEKFIDKIIKPHLYPCHEKNSASIVSKKRTSSKLISLDTDGRKYIIYPLALILKTKEGEIYDFTSTPYLSDIFDANFEEISKTVILNICKFPVTLKEFLDGYNREDYKTVLKILINITKTVDITKTEFLYDTIFKLENDVSSLLKEYKEKYFVNPLPLPYYPKELRQFVTENRADELKDALTYLEKHRILLVSGVGGVGKSTFVRALVDLKPINVPEPLWFNFDQDQDVGLEEILEKLAFYMNVSEIASFKAEKREPGKTDVDKLIGGLQKRREPWLVFDNLDVILEDQQFTNKGIELLFSSLRYNVHNAKIIITSRILPILENGESLLDIVENEEKQHLSGLKANFAIDYLAKNGLSKIEPKKLEELATSVDGHPLALKLLIELVKEFGVKDILNDLSIYKEQKEDTIKKARRFFEKLAEGERELLERISVYREPVSMIGLRELFTEYTPKKAIKKLMDKSLLETDNNGKYWLHPLVREFSYEDLKNKRGAHSAAYRYYNSLPLPKNPIKKEDIQLLTEASYHASETNIKLPLEALNSDAEDDIKSHLPNIELLVKAMEHNDLEDNIKSLNVHRTSIEKITKNQLNKK